MNQQVLVIHGGTTFASHEAYINFLKTREVTTERLKSGRGWRENLEADLRDGFEVYTPKMPNGANARYEEWLIWFERCLTVLADDLILIGHSLGGIFLAKYLAETEIKKQVRALILVAAPFDDREMNEELNDFSLPIELTRVAKQANRIYLIHSEDDPVVPFGEMAKYKKNWPQAMELDFKDREHFNQPNFPELVDIIRLL